MKASDINFPKVIVVEGSAPSNADSGTQKLFIDSSDHKLKRKNAAGGVTTIEAGATNAPDYILIQDQQTQNTQGGDFTSGAWRTRTLNTKVSDTGSHATLASNQITLEAGTYRCLISAPADYVNQHQAILYNITDSSVTLIGTSEVAYAAAGAYTQTRSFIVGKFTIAESKVFEVRHQCTTTKTGNGFGVASNFTTEIYTIVELWKEA